MLVIAVLSSERAPRRGRADRTVTRHLSQAGSYEVTTAQTGRPMSATFGARTRSTGPSNDTSTGQPPHLVAGRRLPPLTASGRSGTGARHPPTPATIRSDPDARPDTAQTAPKPDAYWRSGGSGAVTARRPDKEEVGGSSPPSPMTPGWLGRTRRAGTAVASGPRTRLFVQIPCAPLVIRRSVASLAGCRRRTLGLAGPSRRSPRRSRSRSGRPQPPRRRERSNRRRTPTCRQRSRESARAGRRR